MAQFGALCPDLLENIVVLLARCQMDSDDEVRDRATYYISILTLLDRTLYSDYILDPIQVPVLHSNKQYNFFIITHVLGINSFVRKVSFRIHPR